MAQDRRCWRAVAEASCAPWNKRTDADGDRHVALCRVVEDTNKFAQDSNAFGT